MDMISCEDLSQGPDDQDEGLLTDEDRMTEEDQDRASCFEPEEEETGDDSSTLWSEQEHEVSEPRSDDQPSSHPELDSSSNSSFHSPGVESAHFERHLGSEEEDSMDSLECVVEREKESFLKRKEERQETLLSLQDRSQSAPVLSKNLASPNSSAQRKRSAEGRFMIQTPNNTSSRIEYKPRESIKVFPYTKGIEDLTLDERESKQGSDFGPWGDAPPEEELPNLNKPSKKLKTKSVGKKAHLPTQQRRPNSASNWRSRTKLQRPDWNFDTNLVLPSRIQKRPLSAAEITQKVRNLLRSSDSGSQKLRSTPGRQNRPSIHPYLQTPSTNRRYFTPVLSKTKKPVLRIRNLESAVSEANEMAQELGGRYRYRLINCSYDSSIRVFDCDDRIWLQTPFTLEKFRKRLQLLREKSRTRKLRQNSMMEDQNQSKQNLSEFESVLRSLVRSLWCLEYTNKCSEDIKTKIQSWLDSKVLHEVLTHA